MRKISPLRRDSSFWQGAFVAAYGELLRRAPPSDKVLPGARIAMLARNMADDCERARTEDDGGACEACKGVGCDECLFTGKANPGEGLHAPPPMLERTLSLVGRAPAADGGEPVPSSLDALSRAIANADADTIEKRRDQMTGGGGGGAEPES